MRDNILESLSDLLAEKAKDWSLEERTLVFDATADLTALMVTESTHPGFDADALAAAKATIANVQAAAEVSAAGLVNEAIASGMARFAQRFLLGAP